MTDSAPSPLPLIEMTGLAVGSRENQTVAILENVDWSVRPGEYWVLAGMHGSGRTDLLYVTAGLAPPLKGSCRLFGREMPVRGDQFLSEGLRIGLVFEDAQLFHQLTIEENIALPLRYHREMAHGDLVKIVQSVIEWAGLQPLARRFPGEIPRAWQKRAGLARALVLKPEVLLLDNALGGLDPRHLQWWTEALEELSAGHGYGQGVPRTLVVTAEDLRPWRNRAASFALLQEGRLRVLGHQQDISSLSDPLIKELLSEPAAPAH